ncbi:hypothetical protein NLY43_13125 [Mesorhizobium sp. C416B]|uniref:hypothetical protein n=1 Tax=Mesorhizobium sp. C416B TaxID=2956834 RepID=UPI0003CDFF9D|nr:MULTISPECIES: hypothetical protein [unclassified Mesorhizobium]ESX50644.1 hypothetical protein X760_31975 [Mesorhizobium sp. LSHC422A00]WJI65563.1 hypothetical protein NLY43_13125 [Mesorhizobium sp. C416B]
MTTHTPLARYSAANGALVSGFATAELHHLMGHDQRLDEKFGRDPSRWLSERRTKVNPSKTPRYERKCRRNQDRIVILGQARRVPDDRAGGDRR